MSIIEYWDYGFIQRAVIAGAFIAVLCSTLGVLLVLRRLSLIGDGLAHVTFGSAALGLWLNVYPIYISLPVAIAGSVGILRLTERARICGDAAIGIVSAVGVAVGVIAASSGGGLNVDLFGFLFGNILSINPTEVLMSVILSCAVIGAIAYKYQDIFAITFDEDFAKASGINVARINTMIVIFTAVTVVQTMKLVGIMLTSALIIFPAVTAFQLAKGFRSALFIAAVSALASVVTGIAVSLQFSMPTGACIVLVNFIFFMAAAFYRRIYTSSKAPHK